MTEEFVVRRSAQDFPPMDHRVGRWMQSDWGPGREHMARGRGLRQASLFGARTFAVTDTEESVTVDRSKDTGEPVSSDDLSVGGW
ncbi:hypothetical protein SAMN05216371_0135 [Streptomyces sp. TLI_053]|uniref:hypothetical protein n=1 Tax=Streptomyces sp. TLI_053 TaxID=1855352 RepID=UPI000879E515|nr:hypothetical protein [Streptomyces sp. TLI_053]SDS54628.1 hypothetical protein SAMN05216371_0135 [Streptomyces sp. TLI_053]